MSKKNSPIMRIKNAVLHPKKIAIFLLRVTSRLWSDEAYLKALFWLSLGYKLDLRNPKTFNEKLQWLKIYNRKEEYTLMVDKVEAKKYVASVIGEEYIIPTLAVYNGAEEIDFDALPNQFVLKCTHDSGGIVICKDKAKIDKEEAIRILRKGLKRQYYWQNREWPYKNVKPRIIAEQYMTDDGQGLTDYKIHCFNGVPEVILACKDRFSELGISEDFYSQDWKHLDISRPGIRLSNIEIKRPETLQKMLNLSQKLSENLPFVRVDFYQVAGNLFFGELTFYPSSGCKAFVPKEWDMRLGKLITLNEVVGGVGGVFNC